jgi:hypothetical protein
MGLPNLGRTWRGGSVQGPHCTERSRSPLMDATGALPREGSQITATAEIRIAGGMDIVKVSYRWVGRIFYISNVKLLELLKSWIMPPSRLLRSPFSFFLCKNRQLWEEKTRRYPMDARLSEGFMTLCVCWWTSQWPMVGDGWVILKRYGFLSAASRRLGGCLAGQTMMAFKLMSENPIVNDLNKEKKKERVLLDNGAARG